MEHSIDMLKKEPTAIAPTKDMGGPNLLTPTISTWYRPRYIVVVMRGVIVVMPACSRTTMPAHTNLQFPNNSYMISNSFLFTGLQYWSQLVIHADHHHQKIANCSVIDIA